MAEIVEKDTKKDKTLLLVRCAVWTAMLIFAFHACTRMVAAGDTWVAMACGRHFVNHGVDTVEPFSYNSHKAGPTEQELERFPEWLHPAIKKWHPTGWINQNWLTQVIFYRLTTMFGSEQEPAYNLLVVWKFAINLLVIICLYFSARLIGASRLISAVFICLALYVSRSFIDIRPAVFSNVIVPLYIYILLLSLYKRCGFIYLLVPLLVFWANVHGGYLYAFIVIAPFWFYLIIQSRLKWSFITPTPKGLALHTFYSGILSFIAMVVFNPYHLTNLTHTFIITVSEHAAEWKNVNEWHSAFKLSNPVGQSLPFLIMFFASLAILAIWFIYWLSKPAQVQFADCRSAEEKQSCWVKLPVIEIFIALFTCAMALSSRRFIPIAAYALAPLLSLVFTQMAQMYAVKKNNRKINRNSQSKSTQKPEQFFAVAILAVSIGLGVLWVGKYHKIYLAPWPIDDEKTSVFMRMTASYAKPFRACEFIRANELSGKMLNYWTEGGFVAYYQTPDENTGEIPLKIFMDGRAQAAYDIEVFQEYNGSILSGGELGQNLAALSQSQSVPPAQIRQALIEVADYLNTKLTEHDAWIILMPLSQQRGLFMRAITSRPNWRLVYTDSTQIILVNTDDNRGKTLLDGVFSGETTFPDENYRDVVKSVYLRNSNPEEAFKLATEAFTNTRCSTALNYILNITSPGQEESVYDFCRNIVRDFLANEKQYKNENGFAIRQANAIMALNHIGKTAAQREPQRAAVYQAASNKISSDRTELLKKYNW